MLAQQLSRCLQPRALSHAQRERWSCCHHASARRCAVSLYRVHLTVRSRCCCRRPRDHLYEAISRPLEPCVLRKYRAPGEFSTCIAQDRGKVVYSARIASLPPLPKVRFLFLSEAAGTDASLHGDYCLIAKKRLWPAAANNLVCLLRSTRTSELSCAWR